MFLTDVNFSITNMFSEFIVKCQKTADYIHCFLSTSLRGSAFLVLCWHIGKYALSKTYKYKYIFAMYRIFQPLVPLGFDQVARLKSSKKLEKTTLGLLFCSVITINS